MSRPPSAGVLLFRRGEAPSSGREYASGSVEVLLGHMGGPFWAGRDDGAWSIPKGEHGADEEPRDVALREFAEEMGTPAPVTDLVPLGEVRQSGGKRLTAWAAEGDLDAVTVVSNTFALEWPPRSGRLQEFPEVDRAAWMPLDEAREKLVRGQVPLLDRLLDLLR